MLCAVLFATTSVVAGVLVWRALAPVFFDRSRLPDLGPLERFEFPAVGRIYDANGRLLIELAREYRQITPYSDIPPVVRDALLAAEDKRFFAHDGVDYLSLPRVVVKVRVGAWLARLTTPGRWDSPGRAIFPQGGSTITQQQVRGVFLREQTAQENSAALQGAGTVPRYLAALIGPRNTNKILRKREELRLSLWLEREMTARFGSKQRAKEEIFARYASYAYMGHGQYGLARAASYYFGRPLSSFTLADADKAALLAGIAKAPRDYAPTGIDSVAVLRRRNQTLDLMADRGFISEDERADASTRPAPTPVERERGPFRASAVVQHVLDELAASGADDAVEDLFQGRVQVYSTVDLRVQGMASDALERGLERYERRHPSARGLVQGSVVVLRNRDGGVLAESGGRQVYRGHQNAYSDFNRVRQSLRQPGSAMKPMVYLAAFARGTLTLDTLVPDEPIAVSTGTATPPKWIANYDGRFKGLIPVRLALAESRNAVAIWLASRIGIGAVQRTARGLGVETPLQSYPTTALGASEVNLLELASAYRAIASGVVVRPHAIGRLAGRNGERRPDVPRDAAVTLTGDALGLIQEGLRGVVRLPTGTAHALDTRDFPVPVMGKTGTTNDFRDALFVGSTYGLDGITVAVRIGFDDNRSLGPRESGALVALPVFRDVMRAVYQAQIVGPAPAFPRDMEERISGYLRGDVPGALDASSPVLSGTEGEDGADLQ